MGSPDSAEHRLKYQGASDVNFDGIRLEVLSDQGDILFDVILPDRGPVTVNTFSKEAPIDLITAAVVIATQRQTGG